MVKVNKNILDQSAKNVPNKTMKPKYITVHNTANTSKGANAEMHSRYQHNGSGGRQASWHYSVDDIEVYQTLEDNQQGWHAGDRKGRGNTKSIGIEICENSDGDFDKAVNNAQGLIAELTKEHNIPLKNVVTHKYWSGKNCPRKLIDVWDEFIADIGDKEVDVTSKPVSKPKPTVKKHAKLRVDGYMGRLTISALQRYFKTPVDGVLSNPSLVIKALQRFLGTTQDGYVSEPKSSMVSALQRRFKTPIDGKISKPSLVVKELQRRLNQGKL